MNRHGKENLRAAAWMSYVFAVGIVVMLGSQWVLGVMVDG